MNTTLCHRLALAAAIVLVAPAAVAQTQSTDGTHTQTADSTRRQGTLTVEGDTLREIIINGEKELPIEEALRRSLGNEPRQMSMGDVLERLSPGLNDKITHPFAFKQRKQERRHKRWMQRIGELDRVRTFDELLREAYIQQMYEDSIAALKADR
jgi:hypothetical protein